MALPKTHPEWLWNDNPNKPLQKDVEFCLSQFKEIKDSLKAITKYGDKSPIGQVYTMSIHAYDKRYESEERYFIDCVMALLQYEYYSKKILQKGNCGSQATEYLNKIINIVIPLRRKWKIPAFKLTDDITYHTVDLTLDKLKELTVGKLTQVSLSEKSDNTA